MDLNGKRVLVVGLGRSGVASALFVKSRGARVTVSPRLCGSVIAVKLNVQPGARWKQDVESRAFRQLSQNFIRG